MDDVHSPTAAQPLSYQSPPADPESVAAARALRLIGTCMLSAILLLSVVEFISAIAVTLFDFMSPRVLPSFSVFLVYFTIEMAIAIVALQRTRRAPLPMPVADARFIVRCWLWLGGLRLAFVATYTVIAIVTSHNQPTAVAGSSTGLIVRTLAFAFEAVLPMLVVPLLSGRRLIEWPRRLFALIVAYGLVRLTLEIVPFVQFAMSEAAVKIRSTFRGFTGPLLLRHPILWLLALTIVAIIGTTRRRPQPWLMIGIAVVSLVLLGVTYLPNSTNVRISYALLLASVYTLYNALVTLAPAWVLGWLGWMTRPPRRGREPQLAEPVER